VNRFRTADTSVVVPALTDWHEHHRVALAAIGDVRRLPAHVLVETYSVLTRLPHGLALVPADASQLLLDAFPEPALTLDAGAHLDLIETLVAAGIRGGQVYDAVVASTAARADAELLTLDSRAINTYRVLRTAFRLVS
jgi:predicted nucleic acid-binding protein